MKEKNAALGRAFTQYVLEHPDLAEQLPFRAHLIFQIMSDEAYNAWAERIGREGADPDQPVVYVIVEDFDPATGEIRRRPQLKELVKY
ncbi:hypothetical protein LM602_07105 [Candidatus Acetothermia bacterium]|jgi:hypothetical protein|nr:hypothetical protein [Candidatus Acetothermia bacterium]MCI2432302.1 hypothetical protein [Candidatus Acetothermia bacterium]MCI2437427.1 hypothetical protein [Candidatus Acetothermia bacterium]